MELGRIFKQPATGAKLFDRPIQNLQDALGKVSYLNHIFGRAERLVKEIDGRRVYTPNVYFRRNNYILLTPDARALGNYCFFVREEPERMGVSMGLQSRMHAPFSLVVWVDMRTVSTTDNRNVYQFERDILDAISTPGVLKKGGLKVTNIYHTAEKVFDGFSLDEVDNQFLMSPYCGIRIQMEIWIDEDCTNQI